MDLEQFKQYAIKAGSVSTPAGSYLGECVSLIQQYLNRVYGIPFTPRGHAKDWATNGNVLSHFDRVGSPQAGDIGISGATASNPYGHIWIYTSPSTILEQNGRVSRRVSTGAAYANPIAILRRKGTGEQIMKPTAQQVKDLFTQFDITQPSQAQINHYTQLDIRALFQDLLFATKPTAAEVKAAFSNMDLTPTQAQIDYYTQYTSERLYSDLNKVVKTQGTAAQLQKKIDELIKNAPQGGFTDADRVVAASTNSIVKQILDKIGGIFK